MRWLANLIVKAFGYRELRLVERMKAFETLSREELRRHQLRKLNALVAHFRTYPFYARLLADHGVAGRELTSLEELSRLPVITKDVIMANLATIAERPEAKLLNSTSGSTGRNFQFYQDQQMLLWRRAANIVHMQWIGVDYWKDRKFTVWGLSPKVRRLADLSQRLKVWLQNGRRVQAYGLDEERCAEILRIMHRYRPAAMTAYPGYAFELARVGRERQIAPPQIRAVVVSGEMLLDHQREAIEGYFACKVFNRYGSREFGSIAHQCSQGGGLHVHPGRLYVEADQQGELLITDLNNFATPFIRYAIGDAGQVSDEPCACGRQFQSIVDLTGRTHDILRTSSGRQLPGQFWTTLSRSVPGIEEFQVVQKDAEHIELRVKAGPGYRDENEHHLHDKLRSVVGDEIAMDVVKVDSIELTAMGKRRFVIRADQEAGR